MYDKIFKPKKHVLSNGKIVEEKASRRLFYDVLLLIVIIFAAKITDFDINVLRERGYQFFVILGKMFPPNVSYLSKVWDPLFDTIKMSLIGSILGAILAIPFAVFASSNINKSKIGLSFFRFFISILRTFPTIVVALIATYIFGLGTMAGSIAIFVFTFSYIGKQLYETIETVDMGAFEAAISMGSTRVRAFFVAIFPQILPSYLSVSLYCFEGNVRYASILGYVGAGGLGLIINDNLGLRRYSNVGMIIVVLFFAVVIIESLSHYIRSRLT
jgi:phosphonate transport system permease protein